MSMPLKNCKQLKENNICYTPWLRLIYQEFVQNFLSSVFYFCVSVLEKADCTITMADKDLFDLMTGKLEGQKVRVIENS